jgi:glycosyltransferase involved in cell wall biosynthesis
MDSIERDRGENPPFSVIIPVYNEELAIAHTLDELEQILDRAGSTYEILAIDDGSSDATAAILQQWQQRDRPRPSPHLRVYHHSNNLGYGAALKTGIRHAKHPLIAITDADGTYPSDRIPHLVALTRDADMVIGARIGANVRYSNLRKIPKWFLVRFAEWVTRCRIPDLNSGLRVFRKDIAEQFLNILPDGFSFTTTIAIAMLTNHYIVDYEPIDYHPRIGKSKIQPIRDTLRFLQIILRTGVYFAPLRVFLPVAGVFFSGFLITLFQDLFIRQDLTERTLILLVTSTQLGMFALLADMIDKRSR